MKTELRLLKNTQRYRRTKKGILTNSYQNQKSRYRVDYTLKELHNRFLNDKMFNRIYNEWVKSGYNMQFKPSIDRIDSRKHYSLKNIHCMSWAENRYKQSKTDGKRGRKPAVLQMKGEKVIKRFISQRHAVKELNISQGNLSSCLNGKRKFVKGYKFIYENKELLNENLPSPNPD